MLNIAQLLKFFKDIKLMLRFPISTDNNARELLVSYQKISMRMEKNIEDLREAKNCCNVKVKRVKKSS